MTRIANDGSEILEALSEASAAHRISRRSLLRGAGAGASAAAVGAASFLRTEHALAASDKTPASLAASPPAGFTPFAAPGRVVRVEKADALQPNELYPKPEATGPMLEKALCELTGEPDLVKAVARFVHKDDKVCVKVNGIAKQNMATNKELVLPFIEAMIAAGVPATSITVLEQYRNFLQGTRISERNVPAGVKVAVHLNEDATMPERIIQGTGVRTKFARVLTESTAVINFALVKDHSICGYTGALKNMTHGCTINPQDFHGHHASPQIALLYAQDVVKSRVRLCIADAFKVMAHGGPLWKQPQYVSTYGSIFVSTDPVAIDTIGWEVVEAHRAAKKLRTLTAEGREPAYIKAAADLGLGIADRSAIKLQEFKLG
jgi:uncharacterized protein (DUF362 family)